MNQWEEAKNILCIRLDAMGDLLMTTPAIQSLKEAVPGRKITLLTSEQGGHIASSINIFDKVITYSAPWLKASGNRVDPKIDLEMIDKLKNENFDGAIIFTVYSQNPLPSALMCFLANIPLRASFCRENPYSLLTNWIVEDEPEKVLRHEVRRHLDLVKHLGASGENLKLSLSVDESSMTTLMSKLVGKCSPELRDWVVIHPGSTASSRRYKTSGFAEVADLIIEKTNRKIFFTGSGQEKEIVQEIQSKMKNSSEDLSGLISLKEMIALLFKSPLLISNNSGPIHMAAALGTPVVDLYALTNPQHTPWMVSNETLFHDVSCRFCYKSICPQGTNACLNNISPETIYEAAERLLMGSRASARYDEKAILPLQFPMLLKKEENHDYT